MFQNSCLLESILFPILCSKCPPSFNDDYPGSGKMAQFTAVFCSSSGFEFLIHFLQTVKCRDQWSPPPSYELTPS